MDNCDRYQVALCPYLAVGNRRMLVHLDAFGVPLSLQWPRPGDVDRLAWRDPFDEWPFWDELTEDVVRTHMPYFEYQDGSRDYIHSAKTVYVNYIEDTNVLCGTYHLPGGATVKMTSFVASSADIWARHYEVAGKGHFVHQSEFFEKAVRGNPESHTGKGGFKGAFMAAPQGVYVIVSEESLVQEMGKCAIPVSPKHEWTIYLCIDKDMRSVEKLAQDTLSRGYDTIKAETISADRQWIAKARKPANDHPFIAKYYKRWLLANSLCVTEDGAALAAPRPFWSFSWPRDSSMIAASFALAGYIEEARNIVSWHLDNTPPSGIHEARYDIDRLPVTLDHRDRQGDNPGFLAWACSFLCRQQWDLAFVNRVKDKLFRLADVLVEHRDEATGLMKPEADYWEGVPAQSLCIAVAGIGGLKGAAEVAERLGLLERAQKYRKRADEMKLAACSLLWDDKERYFIRSINPEEREADVAICLAVFLAQAWSKDDPMIAQAITRVKQDQWDPQSGAMVTWPGTPLESLWFYHTAMFLLGAAEIGDTIAVSEILACLQRNVSPQGLIPEQIGVANGHLWGGNYLVTSQALLLVFAYQENANECV